MSKTRLADAAVTGTTARTTSVQPGFCSHAETAAYLGIPEATLYQLDCKGTGPKSYKIGRHRKYRPTDVDAWCEARATAAGGDRVAR